MAMGINRSNVPQNLTMSRRYENSGSHQSYSYPTQQPQQHGASTGPGKNGHPSHQPNYHDSRGPPINPTDKGHARRSPLPAHHCQPQSHPELLQHPHRTWFEKCTPLTRTIAHYDRKEQIGEGTFGQVYKAICPSTGRIVALKKIRLSVASEGLPRTVIREIKILKALQHPNMVRMIEVVSSKGYEYLDKKDERSDEKKKDSGSSIELKSKSKSEKSKKKDRIVDPHEKYKGNLFLVLEYISHDLSGILDMGIRFELVQSKCIFRQLLSVLQYMHSQGYVHRDLKSSNILIDQYYRVKLADFGLARSMDTKHIMRGRTDTKVPFTNKVVTLWYRPPELLLGETDYDEKVDIWSAGCILAELLLGKALFPGTSEMDQLSLIFKMIGTPTEETWEGYTKLLENKAIEVTPSKKAGGEMRNKYKDDKRFPRDALSLVGRMLELDPNKRWSAKLALESLFFRTQPIAPELPENLGVIPVGGDSHEFQTKRIRKQAKANAQKASAAAKSKGENEKIAYEKAYSKYLEQANEAKAKGIDLSFEDEKEKSVIRDTQKSKKKEQEKRKSKGRDRGKEKERDRSRDRHRDRDSEQKRRRRERDRSIKGSSPSKDKEGKNEVSPQEKNTSNDPTAKEKKIPEIKELQQEEERDSQVKSETIKPLLELEVGKDVGKEHEGDQKHGSSSLNNLDEGKQHSVSITESNRDGKRREGDPSKNAKNNLSDTRDNENRREKKDKEKDYRTRDKRESSSRSRREKRRRDGSYDYDRERKEKYRSKKSSRSRDESKERGIREGFEEKNGVERDRSTRPWKESDREGKREKRRRRSSSHDRGRDRNRSRERDNAYSNRGWGSDERYREREDYDRHDHRHNRNRGFDRDGGPARSAPAPNDRDSYWRQERSYRPDERSQGEHGRQRDYRRHDEKRYRDGR